MANKQICSVDVVDSMTDEDKLLVNIDGKLRQIKVSEFNSNLDTLSYGDESGNSNLLNLNKCSFNKNNISISLEDNEITVNGSYHSNLLFDKLLDAGSYSISFKVKSSTDSYSVIRVLYEDDTYSDAICSATNIVAEKKLKGLMLYSSGSANVGTAVFKNIQIEKGTTVTPYKPYIPSVKMLAEEVSAQNESLGVIGKCKNLLNPTLKTTTLNGVTCTNNGDGTYTLNGTSTDIAIFRIKYSLDKGTYKLVGCPNGGGIKTYYLDMRTDNGEQLLDMGHGVIYTTEGQIERESKIIILSGVTCNNIVFKPMMTTNLNATYDDFVPYTGDGDTLTHDVAELNNGLKLKNISVNNINYANGASYYKYDSIGNKKVKVEALINQTLPANAEYPINTIPSSLKPNVDIQFVVITTLGNPCTVILKQNGVLYLKPNVNLTANEGIFSNFLDFAI